MSEKQKELRIRINNCKVIDKRKEMKSERNRILHNIKKTIIEDKEKQLDEKIKEIDKTKDTTKMFKAIKELTRKKLENTYVHDETGKSVTNPQEIYNIINKHFQEQFNDETAEYLEPFKGPPKNLNNEITTDEVKRSVKILNNNRAPGYDKITAEMVKYGPESLHKAIAKVLNKSFAEHREIDIGKGILAPINKPNKIKGPVKNLRAVTLLPIIRKILSNITLERIK